MSPLLTPDPSPDPVPPAGAMRPPAPATFVEPGPAPVREYVDPRQLVADERSKPAEYAAAFGADRPALPADPAARRASVLDAMTDDERAVVVWFIANGVEEWLPENLQIAIDDTDDEITLTYSSYEWTGPRGWDSAHIRHGVPSGGSEAIAPVVARTVPLVAPLTPEVHAAIARAGGHIVAPGQVAISGV